MNVVACTKNILSLCSGVGGLELGLAIATNGRIRTVCHVEREAYAAAILATRMEQGELDHAPIWSDVATFDGKPWRGIVHGIVAGYPCQPFSTAGLRRGEHDPRHIWPRIVGIIEDIQPEFVFFENVSGHLTLGFDSVANDLQKLGFSIAVGLFTASEVGAPHRRERLFIFGLADNAGVNGKRPVACEKRQGSSTFGDNRCGLADAPRTRSEPDYGGLWEGVERISGGTYSNTEKENRIGGGAKVGIFPPGPKDFTRWKTILSERPDLAPAIESEICGMVDGLANRTHRLRTIGNGVVPLCAANAFVSLCAALDSTRIDQRNERE